MTAPAPRSRRKKVGPIALSDAERQAIGDALRAVTRIPGRVFVHPAKHTPVEELQALARRIEPDREWEA